MSRVFNLRSKSSLRLDAYTVSAIFLCVIVVIGLCTALPLDWPDMEHMGFWLSIHIAQAVLFFSLMGISWYTVRGTRWNPSQARTAAPGIMFFRLQRLCVARPGPPPAADPGG